MPPELLAAPPHNDKEFPLARICASWLAKIEMARSTRKPWKNVADECIRFYSESYDFLWDSRYPEQFKAWTGTLAPKFRMTINKAFELVALYGPVIYARNPVRNVTPRQSLEEVSQDLLGLIGLDQLPPPPQADPMTGMPPPPEPPQITQIREMLASVKERGARSRIQAALMQNWLNWTVKEGPGGGFKTQAELAVTEAMVKGRGIVWVEPYTPPNSDKLLIISSHDDSYNMLVDPDAVKADLGDAQFVIRECVHPSWQVEREYGLPAGSVPANFESHNATSEAKTDDDLEYMHRQQGQTNDLVRYYKIYSKMGLGGRLKDLDGGVRKSLESLGDFCFLVVCPGVPYPLNLPPNKIKGSVQAVRKLVEWPIPYWKDGRWPFAKLDFYSRIGSPWPIPPLAPGLGELKFMTLMMSHLTNRIWSSCRNIVGVLSSCESAMRQALESGKDLEVVGLPAGLNVKEIKEAITFLEFPPVNIDVWKMLDAAAQMFDKRVGLTDLVYGLSQNQMRSAQEAAVKEDRISVRPDYMAAKVEDFLSEVARMEAMATRWFVKPEDVMSLMGPVGAHLWQENIMSHKVDEVAFELDYTVEAGSARKRNKEQEIANIQEVLQPMLPVLSEYAVATTDTKPINRLFAQWGKAIDKADMQQLELGPWAPPPSDAPSPEEQKMQLEQQKMEGQMQLKQEEFGLKVKEAEMKQQQAMQEMQMEQEKFMAEMAMEREKFQMEMQMKQQEAAIDIGVKQQTAAVDLQVAKTQAATQIETEQMKAEQQQKLGEQKIAMGEQAHKQKLTQAKQEGQVKVQNSKAQGQVAVQTAKAKAAVAKKTAAKKPAKKRVGKPKK